MKAKILAGVISFLLSNSGVAAVPESDKSSLTLFFSASVSPKSSNYVPPVPDLTLMSGKVIPPTSCKGNIGLSFSNAFTDGTLIKIFENFENIVSDLASPEGAVYLLSLYVSKSNPSLYQLITEGIDLTVTDFLSALGSCEAMADSIVANMGDPLIQMQRNTKLNTIIEENLDTAVDGEWNHLKVEDLVRGKIGHGEHGIELFKTDEKKGGASTPEIDLVKDTLHYGWCIYRGYTKEECEAHFESSDRNPPLLGISDYENQIFNSVNEMHRLGQMIIGNKYIKICDGCKTLVVPGKGVRIYLEEEQEKLLDLINDLSRRPLQTILPVQYDSVSLKPAIVADANYFRNLTILEVDIHVRNMYANGWAYDVAYQRASLLLNLLDESLYGLLDTEQLKKGGLQSEIREAIERVNKQREILENHSRQNNYIPKMYVRALLNVSERVSSGKDISSLSGIQL